VQDHPKTHQKEIKKKNKGKEKEPLGSSQVVLPLSI